MLQVGAGEAAGLYLRHAARRHVRAEQRAEHQPDAALALAAAPNEHQQLLPLRRRQQAVAHELLQRRDVLGVEQLAEKAQPGLRRRRALVVGHREPVAAELALLAEAPVEEERAVRDVDAVALDGQVRRVGLEPQRLEQIRHALREPGLEEGLETFVDLAPQRVLVRDAALDREKGAVYALHRVDFEEFLAELDLIDVLAVVPFGELNHRRPPSNARPPAQSAVSPLRLRQPRAGIPSTHRACKPRRILLRCPHV